MFNIGNLKLSSRIILAPMAGVSDLPFRLVNRMLGCNLAFTEMVSACSLCHRSDESLKILSSNRDDRPLGVQFLGNSPDTILRAVESVLPYKFDLIDLNSACPVKKIVRSGAGADLLRDPDRLRDILQLMAGHAPVPVTIKIRSGWDAGSINACDIAALAQDCGAAAVFIHGRTRKQGYSGMVDYRTIAMVKKRVSIPVIASGDILNSFLAKKMFDETGCDAVMAARGAMGNPWVFKEMEEFLRNGVMLPKPSPKEIAVVMRGHLNLIVDFYGEEKGVLHFRKFFGWYTKGFSRVRPLRMKAFLARTKQDMEGYIEKFSLRGGEYMINSGFCLPA